MHERDELQTTTATTSQKLGSTQDKLGAVDKACREAQEQLSIVTAEKSLLQEAARRTDAMVEQRRVAEEAREEDLVQRLRDTSRKVEEDRAAMLHAREELVVAHAERRLVDDAVCAPWELGLGWG